MTLKFRSPRIMIPPAMKMIDAEGAGHMFRVSTLDLANLPRDDQGAVDHNQDFFGRETLIDHLVAKLDDAGGKAGSQGRFLAIVGPSGSGKSSVVKAGLLPAVRAGGLAGDWFTVEMTPALGAGPRRAGDGLVEQDPGRAQPDGLGQGVDESLLEHLQVQLPHPGHQQRAPRCLPIRLRLTHCLKPRNRLSDPTIVVSVSD